MEHDRLTRQIAFIVEIDKLKKVTRQTILTDRSRHENDAEHSWHLATMALLLGHYAQDASLDLFRVVKMVLIHDLVEIDAGDTYCYDDTAREDQTAREKRAAQRIFALLPDDQAEEFHELWTEFEIRHTPEARFAAALDCLQPLLHNYHTDGTMWKVHGIQSGQVLERNRCIADSAPELWRYAEQLIHDAVAQGMLEP
jgi:putative hydrolase of HD superfamily